MTDTAFGHRLNDLYEGATVISGGEPRPMPLTEAALDVRILGGLAIARTTRRLTNRESVPIEVIMTFPVGFEATVTALTAEVEGRILTARAKLKGEARASYEAAIDSGKLTVLHEEVLRGVHMLSVGNLAPNQMVCVTLEQVLPVSMIQGGGFLRLPQTVGQLYGNSPLQPADDLVASDGALKSAQLRVESSGPVVMQGVTLPEGQTFAVALFSAVELSLPDLHLRPLNGSAADGHRVEISFAVVDGSDDLDLAILFDRSGSTEAVIEEGHGTVWSSMRDGLERSLALLRQEDRVALWQFADSCDLLGTARGSDASRHVAKIKKPGGGTELGNAIEKTIDFGSRDLLVLTDGQTWSHEVNELAGIDCRISAVLVGKSSLDATIGHLVAMKGGQLFYAPDSHVEAALHSAFLAARNRRATSKLSYRNDRPAKLTCRRGGLEITVNWSDEPLGEQADAIGRFSAGLAIAELVPELASQMAIDHGLCGHYTSLVLFDEAGEAQTLMPEQRKVGLALGASMYAESRADMGARFKPDFAASSNVARSDVRFPTPLGIGDTFAIRQLARRIDWDKCANKFLQGDMSVLSVEERRLLRRCFYRAHIVEHAASLGLAIDIVAMALVAVAAQTLDSHAARFARRILGPEPGQVYEQLMRRTGRLDLGAEEYRNPQ